ncbi:MAG: AAA family ATPase [Lachnospiraceae bacterium]|nr:AAA family ATPase [Lachnospiraceae bacterium]
MAHSYSRAQLDAIARDNYGLLVSYCNILESEGYWSTPGSILHQSIRSILDMYVQTVLIRFALYCQKLGSEERKFIANVTDTNVYEISSDDDVSDRVLAETQRFYESPPILLQLCGLRDNRCGSGLIGLFFDALLNIELSMAFIDTVKTGFVASFIHDYFVKVEAFLGSSSNYSAIVNERYIFKKLCDDSLEKSAGFLKESGESFENYVNTYIYSGTARPLAARATLTSETEEEEAAETAEVKEEPKQEEKKQESPLEKLLIELNSLVGLASVKEEVNTLINLIKVRNMRKERGLPLMDMSFHMVFMGNPGTGKTTVARLISKIYKELGLLSKGTLVETDRSGLVAGYVGQTALKVRDVVHKALGGVLFIDEAYSLASDTQNDFGDEAIETLVKLMEDHRDDLVVIVAGYTDDMKRFLKRNQGLVSRFNKYFYFNDYDDEELLAILVSMAKGAGYEFSEGALAKTEKILSKMDSNEKYKFGNARGIRNMFERMVTSQANRVCMIDDPGVEELCSILEEDVH